MINNKNKYSLRVLLLPELVPSASTCLGEALRNQGIYVKVLSRKPHRFGFRADEYVLNKNSKNLVYIFLKHLWASRYLFQKWDVVHFNYGSTLWDFGTIYPDSLPKTLSSLITRGLSILRRIEIGILRMRKIAIFVHFQGDDAVQGDKSIEIFDETLAMYVDENYYTKQSDELKRKKIKWFDSFVDGIFAVSPDMKWFLPDRTIFLPYACGGILELKNLPTNKSSELMRICHAPSHRQAKGTEYVIEAIENLQEKGLKIELNLVENSSHQETISQISKSDIYIDQLYHGWYGGVAVEAMAMGKPVIAYLRQMDLQFVEPDMLKDLPIICSDKLELEKTLEKIYRFSDSEKSVIGTKSRAFVENWHNPNDVARTVISEYLKVVSLKK